MNASASRVAISAIEALLRLTACRAVLCAGSEEQSCRRTRGHLHLAVPAAAQGERALQLGRVCLRHRNPPGVLLPCPEPNTPLSPKATILIVSARDAPEAAADRTSAIARAAQCRITSPTHSPDPGGFRATIALLNGLGNGEARSLIALGHERRWRVAPDRRAHRYCANRPALGHEERFSRPRLNGCVQGRKAPHEQGMRPLRSPARTSRTRRLDYIKNLAVLVSNDLTVETSCTDFSFTRGRG
jgi:hypothetical protein